MEFPKDADMMSSKGASHPLEALLILVSYTIKKEEMSMDLGLKGKEAIVTGGTRGSSV
jgi:hypothetical protein